MAFGTSTPTSITVVATSSWMRAGLNAAITAAFSARRQPAVHEPDREVRQLGREARVRLERGLAAASASDSSISGHTQ